MPRSVVCYPNMSSLATVSPIKRVPQPQLPVSWYTDPTFFALEQQFLFPQAPRYVGHRLMVPNPGDYYTLPWMNHGKTLVHNAQGIELLSNVCRHRQAVMLQGQGHTRNIVCPLHRWTYDLEGHLLGAPHFSGNPCLNLEKAPLQQCNGLLFDSPRNVAGDIGQSAFLKDFDFSDHVLDRVMVNEYNFNWKTFIEVYLEDYHVSPFHPGLANFVDCTNLRWEFGRWHSVQSVGVNKQLERSGSAIYQRWQEKIRNINAGKSPKQGAIWLVYYPFLMLEWYPHALVVSHLIPRSANSCTNVVEFYYTEDIASFERELVEAEQAAYAETAMEDEEICQRMQDGRNALFAQGQDQRGPYQSPMEDGLRHFHQWFRTQLQDHLPVEQ
jgi:choline monooxygenase